MDKNAQERSIPNKLREEIGFLGKSLERLNPDFAEMMDKLRATDEKIRGQAEQVKDVVRSAKRLVNRRDYLTAATNMSAFHERCRHIAAGLEKFIKGIDLKSYEHLLNLFDDEQRQQLFGYDPNAELNMEANDGMVSSSEISLALMKQAGLSDWWFKMTDPIGDMAHNLSTGRGQAMKALEKRFNISFLKDLKSSSINMYNETQRFLSFLLAIFNQLATAVAKRNPNMYVQVAKKFIDKFAGYHKSFVNYYEKSIVPVKQQYEKIIAEKQQAQDHEKQQWTNMLAPSVFNQSPQQTAPAAGPSVQEHSSTPVNLTQVSPKFKNNILDVLERSRPGAKEDHLNDQKKEQEEEMSTAASFISKLEIIANTNNPKKMMLEILKYSAELENMDPETSLKLLAIAEGISDDINNASVKKDDKKKEEVKKEVPLA